MIYVRALKDRSVKCSKNSEFAQDYKKSFYESSIFNKDFLW